MRVVLLDHANGVSANQARTGGAYCGDQIRRAGEVLVHEVRDDFGIGIRGKFVTGGFELSPQFFVVLDDAVMNDSQTIGDVRVGVAFTGGPMGSPTGVGNAGVTG